RIRSVRRPWSVPTAGRCTGFRWARPPRRGCGGRSGRCWRRCRSRWGGRERLPQGGASASRQGPIESGDGPGSTMALGTKAGGRVEGQPATRRGGASAPYTEAADIEPLREFIRRMTELASRTTEEAQLLEGGRGLLAELIADSRWLPEAFA